MMKSISIVYKKSKRQLEDHQLLQVTKNRRSVDEYYTRLIEKSQRRNLQDGYINTEKTMRIRKRIISQSINVIKLQNKNQEIIEKYPQMKVANIQKKSFSVKKINSNNIFKINLPRYAESSADERFKKIHKSCTLKCLTKLKNPKNVIIALSVDFILNQMNFWEEEQIQQNSAKIWKIIQSKASIIWIVHRQNSAKKIASFLRDNNLQQDGVYWIKPKKLNKMLTVSYYALEKDLDLDINDQLIVVNGLRVEDAQKLHYSLFYQNIPEVRHKASHIHFIKTDINDKTRFNNVLKVLSKQLPQPVSLNHIIKDYCEKQLTVIKESKIFDYQPVTNEFMHQRVENLKKNYSNHLNMLVRKMQGEQSIPFIIGDMLRRNYKTLTEVHNQYRKRLPYDTKEEQQQQDTFTYSPGLSPIKPLYYNRPVYIWKF